jgi:hypothetical protein
MGDLDRFKTQVSHGSNIAVVIGYEKNERIKTCPDYWGLH